jgi:L-seryl-tRNA(Ser) seleniumtransferase
MPANPPESPAIYEELGVPTVVNAASTKTRIGGSLIRPEAVEAMADAAGAFVRLSDLQARASELIADVTGAEAGYVGSGAAACMTLAAAACMAGDDLAAMERLPHAGGLANEIVMPRTHRNGYDHALRAAGARIVDVGNNDEGLGTGSNAVEPWEIESAISEDTAAVAYMEKPYTKPSLEAVVEVAHASDVPVIVDAAAELPPAANLSRFVEQGADLVVFSGGKAIRGPQTTGILAGRREYVQSAALQHLDMHVAPEVWEPPAELIDRSTFEGVPRQGIGRPLKVGKEELAGLLKALELFVEEDQDARQREWAARADRIADGLRDAPGLDVSVAPGGKLMVAPDVRVDLDPGTAGIDVVELVGSLRNEDPRIFVGPDVLDESAFTVNPLCLTDEEADYVVDRVRSYLPA